SHDMSAGGGRDRCASRTWHTSTTGSWASSSGEGSCGPRLVQQALGVVGRADDGGRRDAEGGGDLAAQLGRAALAAVLDVGEVGVALAHGGGQLVGRPAEGFAERLDRRPDSDGLGVELRNVRHTGKTREQSGSNQARNMELPGRNRKMIITNARLCR